MKVSLTTSIDSPPEDSHRIVNDGSFVKGYLLYSRCRILYFCKALGATFRTSDVM